MNDHILITHYKDEKYKNYSLKMLCDEHGVKSHASVNIADGLFDKETWDMLLMLDCERVTEDLLEHIHIRGCNSCPRRVKGFVSVLRTILREGAKHYTYQYAVPGPIGFNETDLVSSVNIRMYAVDVRSIEFPQENPAASVGVANELQAEAKKLPGVMRVTVKYPCLNTDICERQGRQATIYGIIIHLNDEHKWTREQIADWLDSVHDPESGVDLAFKVPEKEEV